MKTLAATLNMLWSKIPKPEKTAFFSALAIGLLAHITIMTNGFFNHDSLLYTLLDTNSTFFIQQGKWLSLIMERLVQGDITSTGIIIPVSLLFLGLTASLTVSILKIKSPLWSAAVGGLTVLFPSVMCANVYRASAIFFSALLLSAIAVFVTTRWKFGFIAGIAILTLSFGVYAVFSGYAAGLFILCLLLPLISAKASVKETLINGVKYIFVLAASAILYYFILQLLLRANNITLMDYRGIDHIGKFTASSLANVIYEAYRKVYYFLIYGIFLYRGYFAIEPAFRVLNWLSLGMLLVTFGWIIIRKKGYKKIGSMILIVVLALLFPLAIHAIAILGQNAYTHWIMCYPFVLVYIALAAGADHAEGDFTSESLDAAGGKAKKILFRTGTIVVLLISIALCRQWFLTTNQAYEYIRYQDQNIIARGIMLVNDIQNNEDYEKSSTVALVGSSMPESFDYLTGDFSTIHSKDGFSGYTGFRNAIIDNERLKVLLRNWIGVSFHYADDAELAQINADPRVWTMPVYPAHGSIAFINGVLIVKLSEIQPEPLG